MRLSNFFITTIKENPSEAEIVSNILMLRAGMIRKVASGIYTYMPMGYRVINKLSNIVRECMNEAGAIELLMPALQPAELWKCSGRWEQYGDELLRINDRHNREFCYGPTHEEVITDTVKNTVKSYKQLPINLYQIQTKFRDEVRPRFGLMRGREFIMKDAYSFDIDNESANISYNKMMEAYKKIFERCGLKYKMVDADSGSIGGSYSHEFMVLAKTGEDSVISCTSCDYAANMEKAETVEITEENIKNNVEPTKVYTPNAHTVQDLANFLNIPTNSIIKTMIIKIDNKKLAAILIRGDYDLNMIKVKNILGAKIIELASKEEVESKLNTIFGFCGPVGLDIDIYADHSIKNIQNPISGANEKDYHINGAIYNRDYKVNIFGDFRNAKEGDTCIKCGGTYEIARGIEVGHIFKLGDKYSKTMEAEFLNKNGKREYFTMGCYGIGIGRTAAACIEQNHDENGICWPVPLAPFEIVVLPLSTNDTDITEKAEYIYKKLKDSRIDVLIDDRNDRAGSKLADADLVGYPFRINIGKKHIVDNNVELVIRKTGETIILNYEDAINKAIELIENSRLI